MRLELRATSYDDDRECCNDFNWDEIDDPIHLKFLQWSLFLEGRITLLSQNIKYYEEFNKLLFGNENALKKYKTFVISNIINYSSLISIGFGILLEKSNKSLNLHKYIEFCKANKEKIFKTKKVLKTIENVEKQLNIVFEEYDTKIKTVRDKVFAHCDMELISKEAYIDSELMKTNYLDFIKMIEILKEILDSIWYQYRGMKVFYKFDGWEDMYQVLHFLEK